jgi:hypothetical protein
MQDEQFAVLEAVPDRSAYRYVYHGSWNPGYADAVTPHLQPIDLVSGSNVTTEFSIRAPSYGERLLVTLSSDEGSDFTSVPLDGGSAAGTLTVDDDGVALAFDGVDGSVRIPIEDRDRVELSASLDTGTATAMTYRMELPVDRSDEGVAVLTPELEVCQDDSLCGGEAGYSPGIYGDQVAINASVHP